MNGEVSSEYPNGSELKPPVKLLANIQGDYYREKSEIVDGSKFVAYKHEIVKGEGPDSEHKNKFNGCEYFLSLKDNERRGHIRYKYGTVEEWDYDYFDGRNVFASEAGLALTDRVLWLADFFPNGHDKAQERYKEDFRQGVGTEALGLVISDAIQLGMKAIRICTMGKPMETFLQKNGFQEIKDDKGIYYLMFDKPESQ